MALDKVLKIYDENGNPVDYDILASDVKFMPDGKDLPTKLTEMEDAIEEAGSGDGTVTGVKVGSTPYNPDGDGVVNLSEPFAEKVDKESGKSLMTDAERTKLQNLPTSDQLTQQLDQKANDNAVVKSISVNGTAQTKDSNGNVNIEVEGGGLSKEDISVETQGDGTVDINVKDDTYTINLNHTHEGMAKLVVDTAANLPDASEMESDTIYGELDDGEIATIYLGGYPFYGGGGASSGPVLRRPADGATIDMGQTTNGTVSKTINVKGKSLTQALIIQLTGTGYSFGSTQPTGVTRDSATQLTIPASSISAVNSLNGVDIVVVYTGNDTDENASGMLGITSASPDNISVEATLVATVYEDLAGVKFTKQQYVETDIHPGPTTRLEIDMQFDGTYTTPNGTTNDVNFIGGGSDSGKTFSANTGVVNGTRPYYQITIFTETTSPYGQLEVPITVWGNRSTLIIDLVNLRASFNGVQKSIIAKTTTMPAKMKFGSNSNGNKPFGANNIILYSLKHYENDVLTHNYLPYTRNGAVGLYDTVTDTFILSSTGVSLVAVNK